MYLQEENVKSKVDTDRQPMPIPMFLMITPVIIPLVYPKTCLI